VPAAARLALLLSLALLPSAAAAQEPPQQPCLTLGSVHFGAHTYVRQQTQSGDAAYAAEYYQASERPGAWRTRLELRSYPSEAGRTPLEVAAGVLSLERSSNPALRATPVALNAEQTLVVLDYVTWSEATLHAGYVEIDVFKFFSAAYEPQRVLGFRFVRKLAIADRSRDALAVEIRRLRTEALQSMLQLPVCEWTVSAPATSA
jgi:hypothetical protein